MFGRLKGPNIPLQSYLQRQWLSKVQLLKSLFLKKLPKKTIGVFEFVLQLIYLVRAAV